MTQLMLIVISAALVNNFVLVQFLGLCPLIGASNRVEAAAGIGLATGVVLTLASGLSYLVEVWMLVPLGLDYLRLMSFILVIGAAVQLVELVLRRASPVLHRVLGLYVPLMASNCAVLGVALLNSNASRSLIAALLYGLGAALGFALVLVLLAGLRERVERADVPLPFRGTAIALVTAGIMSLAFMGFTGFAEL